MSSNKLKNKLHSSFSTKLGELNELDSLNKLEFDLNLERAQDFVLCLIHLSS